MNSRRAPRQIAGAITAARDRWQPSTPLGRAQTAWTEVSDAWARVLGVHGSYLLERVEVVSLRGGVLTVSCAEAVVAETLTLESERLLERLNAQLTTAPIARLRCVVGASAKVRRRAPSAHDFIADLQGKDPL